MVCFGGVVIVLVGKVRGVVAISGFLGRGRFFLFVSEGCEGSL